MAIISEPSEKLFIAETGGNYKFFVFLFWILYIFSVYTHVFLFEALKLIPRHARTQYVFLCRQYIFQDKSRILSFTEVS